MNDALVDLDKEVVVELNGKEVFRGKVTRQPAVIFQSLLERLDEKAVATAVVKIGK